MKQYSGNGYYLKNDTILYYNIALYRHMEYLKTQIDDEYLINIYKNQIYEISKVNNRTYYEFTNILERLFLGLLQENMFPCILDLENKYVKKFMQEINAKHIPVDDIITKINMVYHNVFNRGESNLNNLNNINKHVLKVEVDYINCFVKYKNFYQNVPYKQLQLLKYILLNNGHDKCHVDNIIGLTIIKYDNIINSGNQWRINEKFYKRLHYFYKIDIECFASPINAVLLDKNVPFCSIYDTDKYFGSIGNFFNLQNSQVLGKTLAINPPFIESIINNVYEKTMEWLNVCDSIHMIIIVPDWRDAYFYEKWKHCKYCDSYKIYNKKQLPIEHVKGQSVVHMNNNFKIIIFHIKKLIHN